MTHDKGDTRPAANSALPDRQEGAFSDKETGAQAIYDAVQKIVLDETRALLDADPVASQQEADMAQRIEAALNRLTGGAQTPPTMLEALILEALEPLLQAWINNNLATLVERLVAAEIKAVMAEQVATTDPAMWRQIKP